MAAPKRAPAQREHDLAEIATRYLRGETQATIAATLNVCQQQVSYDLATLRKRWAASGLRDFDQAKGEELAKVDALERVYWQQWEDSTKSHADCRCYLEGVQWCIERRCKLLGLDAPTKQILSGHVGQVVIMMPDNQRSGEDSDAGDGHPG